MANKWLGFLTNNLGTKLMAFLLAGILWLVVYNVNDPNKTSSFTVNVNVVNGDYVTEQNLCYDILDQTNMVTFSVTTKRSNMQRLDNSHFTATADMSKMVTDSGGKTATVPIEITSSLFSRDITYGTKKYLKVSLEDLMSKQFIITAASKGEVAAGCALGTLKVTNPTVIKVSGPESIVSTVDKVTATIDISDMAFDISDNVVPTLYDKNEKEIDTTRLTLSNRTVTVSAAILNMKEVSLSCQTSGTPAYNYRVSDVSVDVEKVRVKGLTTALNSLTSIDIPPEALRINGAMEDIVTEVDITEYLPEGVELVDTSQRVVTVTIHIDEYLTRTFTVPTANITVEGMSDDMSVRWRDTAVDVKISGLKKELNLLSASTIKGTVNVSGLAKGEHTVRVTLELDDQYEVSRVTAILIIS